MYEEYDAYKSVMEKLAARTAQPKNVYEDEDIRLWKEYKYNGNQQAKWELLGRLKGLISKQVLMHSKVQSKPVVEAKLKRFALMAIDKYDPSKGTKLSTFVNNYFQMLNRSNYENMQAIRLPENILRRYGSYNRAKEELKESLGRDPSIEELSGHLGWSLKETEGAEKRFHKEFIESKQVFDPGISDSDISASVLRHVYYDASEHEKFLMHHTMGYMGSPIKKKEEIRSALKLNPYQFSKLQDGLKNKVQKAMDVLSRND